MRKNWIACLLIGLMVMSGFISCDSKPENVEATVNYDNATKKPTDSKIEESTQPQTNVTTESVTEAVTQKPDFQFTKLSDGTYELTKYLGDDTAVVIPAKYQGASISRIGKMAFALNEKITRVTFENGCAVKIIGEHAFGYCTGLKSIEIPASVEFMDGAFVDCYGLQTVSLKDPYNWVVYYSETNYKQGKEPAEVPSLDSNEAMIYFLAQYDSTSLGYWVRE